MFATMKKRDVIRYFGGVVAAAKALGVKHQAVSQWGKVVPERIAYRAHSKSGGAIAFGHADYGLGNDA